MSELLMSEGGPSHGKPHSGWFCLRTQMKHEHIAAAHLNRFGNVEVFFPRIKARRSTRRGEVWVCEPLFANYLFARFDYYSQIETVRYTPGVQSVVHFGLKTPMIPDAVIEELREILAENKLQPRPRIAESDRVFIREGVFQGLTATVLRVMPAKQRVQVLLNILGRSVSMEVHANSLAVES
jgi:transcriptional antiterminator RfaH